MKWKKLFSIRKIYFTFYFKILCKAFRLAFTSKIAATEKLNPLIVNDEYIEGERTYFARCETIWQTEEKGDLPAGFDANRVYCAQDDVHNELLTSVGVSSKIHSNTVKSEVYASAQIANITFNLKKEKDRWLITKILCDQSIQF